MLVMHDNLTPSLEIENDCASMWVGSSANQLLGGEKSGIGAERHRLSKLLATRVE